METKSVEREESWWLCKKNNNNTVSKNRVKCSRMMLGKTLANGSCVKERGIKHSR